MSSKKQAASRGRGRRLADSEIARIQFLGAAGEVTGSHHLLETRGARMAIDCGLYQGGHRDRGRNSRPLRSRPKQLDAVVLTHAHIDHSGLLPKLCKEGFRGEIHATRGTTELCGIMLRDSAHIQEVETRRANRRAMRRGGKQREPLYTLEDAERCLDRMVEHDFEAPFEIGSDVQVTFRRAGHILGASSLQVRVSRSGREKRLVFSGDLGRRHDPILCDPATIDGADVVLMETTYGDRNHRRIEETHAEFVEIMRDAQRAGDNVLIPVFAVGRAQEVLYQLREFESAGSIEPRDTYLDSPMAISVTELYRAHKRSFGPSLSLALQDLDRPFRPRRFSYSRTADESMSLNGQRGITILAASGMCEAGRIVHHLKHNLWRPTVHVVFVGYQARGTTGRKLVDGARKVRILGQEILVRAQIHTVGGFSAHAGQRGLRRWYESFGNPHPELVLIHGEDHAQEAFEGLIRKRLGVHAQRPELGDVLHIPLDGRGCELVGG